MGHVRPQFFGKPLGEIEPGSLVYLTSLDGRPIPPGWGIRVVATYPNNKLDGVVRLTGDSRVGRYEIITTLDVRLLVLAAPFAFVPDLQSLSSARSVPGELLLLQRGAHLHVELPAEHGGFQTGLLDLEKGAAFSPDDMPTAPAAQWAAIDEFERPIFRWQRPSAA